MFSLNVAAGSVGSVHVGKGDTVQEIFLAIYSGSVDCVTQHDKRFTQLLPTGGFSLMCPIMFQQSWYQRAADEISNLLTAKKEMARNISGTKRTASAGLLLSGPTAEESKQETPPPESNARGDARPFRMPLRQKDQYVCYAITGTVGVGKSMFIDFYLDTLSKNGRPADVLLVRRLPELSNNSMAVDEEVYLQLLYVAEAGYVESEVVYCWWKDVPAEFWTRHRAGRPLQVIVDTFLPFSVMNAMMPVLDDVELFLYIASTKSRAQGMHVWPSDWDTWPFSDNVFHVSAMSREDYISCGYACATDRTREFLRAAAGINTPDSDIDSNQGRLLPTPPKVAVVMEYLYEVLGGTARYLLQFGEAPMVGETPIYNAALKGLQEATDGSNWPVSVRTSVNRRCALLIASQLYQSPRNSANRDVLQVRAVTIFFREVVTLSVTGERLLNWAGASAALSNVYLTMKQEKIEDVTSLLKAVTSNAVGCLHEHLSLIATYRTLKSRGCIKLEGVGCTPAGKKDTLFVDARCLSLTNMYTESDIQHLQVGHFAASKNATETNVAMVHGICIQGSLIPEIASKPNANTFPRSKTSTPGLNEDTQFSEDGVLTGMETLTQLGVGQCRGVSILLQVTTAAAHDWKRNDAAIANYKRIPGASNALIMVFVVPGDSYAKFSVTMSEEQKQLRTYKYKGEAFP